MEFTKSKLIIYLKNCLDVQCAGRLLKIKVLNIGAEI